MWGLKWILLMLCIASYNQLIKAKKPTISHDEIFSDAPDGSIVQLFPKRSSCHWTVTGSSSSVNVTCYQCKWCNVSGYSPGLITFSLSGTSHSLKLNVKRSGESALYVLSTSFIQDLLSAKYKYLLLSNFHKRYTAYHPKVAAYFHGRFMDTANMIFTITEYIKMKQATVGDRKPDYHYYMLNHGFKNTVSIDQTMPSSIRDSFKMAIDMDKLQINTLTHISDLADSNQDPELHEFVTNDVITKYTEALKIHSNHYKTLERMANSNDAQVKALAEYLFDKEM